MIYFIESRRKAYSKKLLTVKLLSIALLIVE